MLDNQQIIMTKKKDGGKPKSNRSSRFSLRNILTSTNILAGASNANLPLPTTAGRGKEPFSFSSKKRRSKFS